MDYKQRRQAIEALLDHWNDYFEPSPSGVSDGDGTGVVFVSGMSRWPAVVELVRVLEIFRRTAPSPFARFIRYYAQPKKQTVAKRRVRTATGWAVKEIDVCVRLTPWVLRGIPLCNKRYQGEPCPCGNTLPRTVCTAVDFLLGIWDIDVALELPPAMNRKLVESTDSAGTHLTEARRVA